MIMNQVYKTWPISFGDRKFIVDLLPNLVQGFDVILGMNWLVTCHTDVDYFSKEVLFNISRDSEFQFQGKRNKSSVLIYILKAQKMLTKGCEAFLSFVAVDNSGEVSLSDIRMVKEFLDVFPKDLHWFPFNQKIEFSIDLLPGTAPISKAPYRMALIKIKKLKIQL